VGIIISSVGGKEDGSSSGNCSSTVFFFAVCRPLILPVLARLLYNTYRIP